MACTYFWISYKDINNGYKASIIALYVELQLQINIACNTECSEGTQVHSETNQIMLGNTGFSDPTLVLGT